MCYQKYYQFNKYPEESLDTEFFQIMVRWRLFFKSEIQLYNARASLLNLLFLFLYNEYFYAYEKKKKKKTYSNAVF